MTDSAMFYPLFNKLQEKSIYSPKITNADVYLDYITNNLNNNELENAYQDFTKIFDIKSFEWMYYYVYIILLNDFESIITPFLVNIGTLYYLVFSSYLFIKSFACINKYLK